jgi:hypothetical protein
MLFSKITLLYRTFIPNRAERKAELKYMYNFICSCPACLYDYPPEMFMPRVDPKFPFSMYQSLMDVEGDPKPKMIKASNYIKKNFHCYPAAEVHFCESTIRLIIQKACNLHDWPSCSSKLS